MTALSTRDALAKALSEVWAAGAPFEPNGQLDHARFADALIASSAVVDVATLADDDELVERTTQLYQFGLGRPAGHVFRALAAALAERVS